MHKKVEADTNASILLLIARGTSEKIAIPNVIRMQIFLSVEPSEFVYTKCAIEAIHFGSMVTQHFFHLEQWCKLEC